MKLIIFLLTICLLIPIASLVSAKDLEEAQVYYLKGDYKQAVETLEKVLAQDVDRPSAPEVYYLLGLSYLKIENHLRAGDCFDIITKEYRRSDLFESALIKLIDIDFLNGDQIKALEKSEEFLAKYPKSERISAILLRQYLANLKLGNWQEADLILSRINDLYPHSPEVEAFLEKQEIIDHFTVQVGSFKKRRNAQDLARRLKGEGFDSYISEARSRNDGLYFRVRIGRLQTREEAHSLEKRLIKQGYPTKIYP